MKTDNYPEISYWARLVNEHDSSYGELLDGDGSDCLDEGVHKVGGRFMEINGRSLEDEIRFVQRNLFLKGVIMAYDWFVSGKRDKGLKSVRTNERDVEVNYHVGFWMNEDDERVWLNDADVDCRLRINCGGKDGVSQDNLDEEEFGRYMERIIVDMTSRGVFYGFETRDGRDVLKTVKVSLGTGEGGEDGGATVRFGKGTTYCASNVLKSDNVAWIELDILNDGWVKVRNEGGVGKQVKGLERKFKKVNLPK